MWFKYKLYCAHKTKVYRMSIVPLAIKIYPSSPHSIVALCIIVYVVNNALRYHCDKIADIFETSIAENASNKDLWYVVCCTT